MAAQGSGCRGGPPDGVAVVPCGAVHPMSVFTIACAACVVGLLVAERRGARAGVWVFKPLAAACFIAVALAGGALDTPYGWGVLAGLALSMAGDVLLIPRGAPHVFLAGMLAFGLAHVAYAVTFAARGVSAAATAAAAVILAAAAWGILRWLGPHLDARWRLPVRAYVVVIFSMVALAVGCSAAGGPTGIWLGAAIFAVSDLFVARERFVESGFVNGAVGLPLYFGAQLLIASTVS